MVSRDISIAALVAVLAGLLVIAAALVRARRSRYPALLYTTAAFMAVLHLVWLAALVQGHGFAGGFATLELLTLPWSFAVLGNMSMAGFDTLHGLLLNYVRYVLGIGGLQCLLLTLFVWELKLTPRARTRGRPRSTRF